MKTTRPRLGLAILLLALGGTPMGAQDRIFVDQWSPTQSELVIADADGANPRKLVAGYERDYNASISDAGEWVVFTSERHGSADFFRVRTNGMGLERLTRHQAFDDQAALSPDGRFVAFSSYAMNFAELENDRRNVFVRGPDEDDLAAAESLLETVREQADLEKLPLADWQSLCHTMLMSSEFLYVR